MVVLDGIGRALLEAVSMFWQVLWPLALGFLLSAVIETQVSRQRIAAALGRRNARGVALATGFGAASSSCSYAAVAIARSLFRKGADFGNAIIFEFASTNLVFELALVLLVLLGWPFLVGELSGGILMVALLALAFHFTLRRDLVDEARREAENGRAGRMEGHAAMDMSLTGGSLLRRLFSDRGLTAVAQSFYMGVASVWSDVLLGFLIAGALGAWVPNDWWSNLFLSGHGVLSDVWGALVGPLVAVFSFVCSVGNVPLAAVLWRGGIGFGGAIAFIFADLIIIPIVRIHARYYGRRVALYLFAVSYATMAAAGLVVGLLFRAFGAEPTSRAVTAFDTHPSWNMDTYLDIAFILLMLVLGLRFLRTGGVAMLRMMNARQPMSA
jgi:uncharacterized membrane protein YraQ (UPF0718 family)